MRVNIMIDEALFKEAFRYTSVKTKSELVRIALQEFVQNHSRKDLRDLRGKVSFPKDYDYKVLRGHYKQNTDAPNP